MGTSLFGYVHGSLPAPPETIKVGDLFEPNPSYFKWLKWDRFVNSCLNATFSSTITFDVLGYTTAAAVWKYLYTTFTN